MRTALALIAFVLPCCAPRTATIPDPKIPHRVAEEVTVQVWVRRHDGTLSREHVRLMPGWWIASPHVVE